jgi:hypothetical protein
LDGFDPPVGAPKMVQLIDPLRDRFSPLHNQTTPEQPAHLSDPTHRAVRSEVLKAAAARPSALNWPTIRPLFESIGRPVPTTPLIESPALDLWSESSSSWFNVSLIFPKKREAPCGIPFIAPTGS